MPYAKAQLQIPQYEDVNGNPAVGHKLKAFVWDTSTPTPMYTSSAGAGSATWFTLNSLGEPQTAGGTACDIFLDSAVVYKFIRTDADDQQIGATIGPVYGSPVGDGGANSLEVTATGTTQGRSLAERHGEEVNILDYMTPTERSNVLNGLGTLDVSAAIQEALEDAFAAGKNVRGAPGKYGINTTIIIPQYKDFTSKGIEIDFRNAKFRLLSDTTLLTSGYDNSGTLTTNYGTSIDSYYSQGITLGNFSVESAVTLTQPVMKIQDWHQGCKIVNVSSLAAQQMLWSRNNFYMVLTDIRALYDGSKTGARFVFSESHNLNKFSGLVALNAVTGYRFDGPVTALELNNISFEGQTIGVEFNATAYDVSIENSYMESVSDVMISFNSYVFGARLSNNYVNFGNSATSYLLNYSANPGQVVRIDESNHLINMPSIANIIKVREDSYGESIIIEQPKVNTSTLADLLVDNTIIGGNIDWRQRKKMPGLIGNVINDFVPGNYTGRFTTGYNHSNGFVWVDNSNNTLTITTKIEQNFVQLVYVNIEVTHGGGGPTYHKGVFVGNDFYKFDAAGLTASTALTGSTDGSGFLKIDGGAYYAGTVTGCKGEVRLL